jgi:hypothetical protein
MVEWTLVRNTGTMMMSFEAIEVMEKSKDYVSQVFSKNDRRK